jgi:pSer/pThr/pTyr-binding forkhead associated (FHA) protein
MPARLTLHFGDRPPRVVEVREGRDWVIGRDATSDLVIDDDRVSRRHALLRPAPEGWLLSDLNSKNGSAVNGFPARETPLGESSWVSLGGLLARFEAISEQERQAASAERLRRWRTSLELRSRLTPGAGRQELLRRLLASVFELSGAERGFVLLARADGELEVAAAAGVTAADLGGEEFSGSVGAVEQVLSSGASLATSDALAESGFQARASVWKAGIRALVCVPLKAMDRTIGAVYADSRRAGSVFTELDVEILEALAAHAALAIGAARLDEELRGLAAAVAARDDLEPAKRTRLAAEIEAAVERAQTPLPLPGSGVTTWSGLLAAHGRRGAAG